MFLDTSLHPGAPPTLFWVGKNFPTAFLLTFLGMRVNFTDRVKSHSKAKKSFFSSKNTASFDRLVVTSGVRYMVWLKYMLCICAQ